MCFWFGLEILRLVLSSEKVAPYSPLFELKKKFFEIRRTGYQKKQNFVLILTMCRSLEFGEREKIVLQKNRIFRDLKNLAKIVF
jgi:hypothetical protein